MMILVLTDSKRQYVVAQQVQYLLMQSDREYSHAVRHQVRQVVDHVVLQEWEETA